MPTQDTLQILLPRGVDLGREALKIRDFPLQLFVNTDNVFYAVQIHKIIYSPAWAKLEIEIEKSGTSIIKVAGDGGTVPLDYTCSKEEPTNMVLRNNSIDTECMITFYFRGWQFGE